jgi:hypothetical protein
MSHRTLLSEANAIFASSKLSKLLENVAEEKFAEIINSIMASHPNLQSLKLKLDAFKTEVGDEHYKIIASGQDFSKILDQWVKEKCKKMSLDLIKGIRTLLPSNAEISDQEIALALNHLMQLE